VADRLDLSTEEARELALRALSSYVAGAMMMPYDEFLDMAETHRYDVDLIGNLAGVSFEQAAHRLVTLRRKGREGVPFGFLRADRSGRLTKRFPLPGLTIPGFGHGCLLWPIYDAFSSTGIVRQVSAFPGGGRFLLLAKTVSKQTPRFGQKPLVFSIMLACDIVHADRTVYGDGLDLGGMPVEVGPSCLPCPRLHCGHRQEIPV
jgi:predicted transcriptional regulator